MNALLEFTILSSISFFLFMFIAYRDAIRTAAPKGPLANLFNNISFWKAEDETGIRGYLYRQNVLFKILFSLIATAVIRLIYAFFFDFSIPSELFNIFTGPTAFLMHAGVILIGIYFSYLWPQVRTKAKELTQKAYKDADEKAEEVTQAEKTQTSEKPVSDPEVVPKTPEKKDSNDIIDDYLK